MGQTTRPRRAAQRKFTWRDRERIARMPGVVVHRRDRTKPRVHQQPVIAVTEPIRFEDLLPERYDHTDDLP